jgi:hypothetical protein
MTGRSSLVTAMWTAVAVVVAAPAAAQLSFVCVAGGTEPARWLVPRVEHVEANSYTNDSCDTTILVTNLGTRPSVVQVDFVRQGEHTCVQEEIAPNESFGFGTNATFPIFGLGFVGWAGGMVFGSATVLSAQRNLHVAPYLVCRDGPLSETSKTKVLATTPLAAIQLR